MKKKKDYFSYRSILVFGLRNSGLTKLFGQIIDSHMNRTTFEPEIYKEIIYHHLLSWFHLILTKIPIFSAEDTNLAAIALNKAIVTFKKNPSTGCLSITQVKNQMQQIWQDSCTVQAYQANNIDLPDNAHYFFKNLSRILDDSYVPTANDCMTIRNSTKTIRIQEYMWNQVHYTLIDRMFTLLTNLLQHFMQKMNIENGFIYWMMQMHWFLSLD